MKSSLLFYRMTRTWKIFFLFYHIIQFVFILLSNKANVFVWKNKWVYRSAILLYSGFECIWLIKGFNWVPVHTLQVLHTMVAQNFSAPYDLQMVQGSNCSAAGLLCAAKNKNNTRSVLVFIKSSKLCKTWISN